MSKNRWENSNLQLSLEYVLLFVLLYGLVSALEGTCAHPVLNSAFLFITAPFNPLENCLLVQTGEGAFVSLASNFFFVALLIAGAGYYFSYMSKKTKNSIRMSYVFSSALISTYLASAMSYLYFSRFANTRLKVATGTSIVGFDMCLFMAVFMGLELFYYFNGSGKAKYPMRKKLVLMPMDMIVRAGFVAIFIMFLYSYLNVSLVHLAGFVALPVFVMLVYSFSHKSLEKALEPLKKYVGRKKLWKGV
jgi:hypothetical protein